MELRDDFSVRESGYVRNAPSSREACSRVSGPCGASRRASNASYQGSFGQGVSKEWGDHAALADRSL